MERHVDVVDRRFFIAKFHGQMEVLQGIGSQIRGFLLILGDIGLVLRDRRGLDGGRRPPDADRRGPADELEEIYARESRK